MGFFRDLNFLEEQVKEKETKERVKKTSISDGEENILEMLHKALKPKTGQEVEQEAEQEAEQETEQGVEQGVKQEAEQKTN